jgi:hypothetical protein
MYYIIQENVFREENYNNLITSLDRLKLDYEIVKILPFIDTFEFKTNRKDVFPFGAVKMSRLSRKFDWTPGSQLNDNHDYLVYKDHYKENLLNYDSKIIKFGDDFFQKERFFARPTKDTKVFTGKEFDMEEWNKLKEDSLTNGHSALLDLNTEIQISSVKKIQQEIRFWIVKGKIITASQYTLGGRYCLNNMIDQAAYDFCDEMIKIFQLNDAFVIDVCLHNNKYKIVECGCINSAGFYKADLQKLIISLEESF